MFQHACLHICLSVLTEKKSFFFLFSESNVMQAAYRIWGRVISVQVGCHSPLKQASKAEDSTVNKSGENLPSFVSSCVCWLTSVG